MTPTEFRTGITLQKVDRSESGFAG